MATDRREDILIDTIHDLRSALDECLREIETGDSSDSKEYLIDKAEAELHRITLRTNEIYTEMLSRAIERKETKDLIESKKENTSERV